MRRVRWAAGAALLACSSAWAGPDVYSYDALGRLVKVERPGSSATVRSEYSYDAAGNRVRVVVTDQAPPPPPPPPPAPPSFSISDASAAEGDMIVFIVTRHGDLSGSNSISFGTTGNTASAATDFIPVSGTLTFGPGESTRSISVITEDDSAMEMDETFYLNLSSATGGATIADSLGIGTIFDNDDTGGGCLFIAQEVSSDGTGQDSQVQMLPPPGC